MLNFRFLKWGSKPKPWNNRWSLRMCHIHYILWFISCLSLIYIYTYISQESFNFLAASNVMCFLRDALHLRGQHQIYKYIEKNPTCWMPRQFHESVVLKVPVLPPLCPIIQNHHTHPKISQTLRALLFDSRFHPGCYIAASLTSFSKKLNGSLTFFFLTSGTHGASSSS